MTPEEKLLWDIFGTEEKDSHMQVEQYYRKSFPVEAVRVTEENMEEVAAWCSCQIRSKTEGGPRYIKVRVETPMNERQTEAYVGDWVLYAGKGYKVYKHPSFVRSFDSRPSSETNVFEGSDAAPHTSGSAGANPGGTRVVGG